MLFSNIVLPVHIPLERRENVLFLNQMLPTAALNVYQRLVGHAVLVRRRRGAVFGRDREVLELLAEDDDRLPGVERVLARGRAKVGRGVLLEVLLGVEQPGLVWCPVERVVGVLEEAEHVLEAFWVKLRT
jgi:hypothetical protein